jgi:hypothetical protein
MKTGTVLFAFAAVLFCAGTAFAQDPESYRTALLNRPLPDAHSNFCRQKGGSQADCQVTLNFLKDIKSGSVPTDSRGKDVCPRGASIDYAGSPDNAAKIENRCT